MDIKKQIGNKIKHYRLQNNMTREMVCDDESEISIRQLARIESGESLPTLTRLSYLSAKLNVSLNHIIDESKIKPPEEYILLKHKIIKQTIYKDKHRIELVNHYFDQIYEKFYDDINEEEQLIIDVLHASHDILVFKNVDFEAGLLGEYFNQILIKKELAERDFHLIYLYIIYIIAKDIASKEKQMIQKVIEKLIDNSSFSNNLNAYLVILVQIPALYILLELGDYSSYRLLLQTVKIVAEENQEFQKLPIIQMMEGKYQLFYKKNVRKAKEIYERAAQTAELLGDCFLHDKILKELEQDLKI